MDSLRLLSRSTKRTRLRKEDQVALPSQGRDEQPQLFPAHRSVARIVPTKKRKRAEDNSQDAFDESSTADPTAEVSRGHTVRRSRRPSTSTLPSAGVGNARLGNSLPALDERKRLLKEHKLKFTLLNPHTPLPKRESGAKSNAKKAVPPLFPAPLLSFKDLSSRYSVSHQLAGNVSEQGFDAPTEVQLGALPLLLDGGQEYLHGSERPKNHSSQNPNNTDLLTIAPTGSGKTLAFLIPLIHSLLHDKHNSTADERHTGALILAPTRELASQIVNEGRKLTRNTGLRVTQMRRGMRLGEVEQSRWPDSDRNTDRGNHDSVVKADIVVATPGVLHSTLHESKHPRHVRHVRHLILDEADVLLDPLFREQTIQIWNSLVSPELRVSMWSATMGSSIEDLAMSTIGTRRVRLRDEYSLDVNEAPFIRLIVGLKDSAVPNVQHKLVYAATEQGKLMGLRQLLHPTSSSTDSGPPLRPPLLVFTQTIERAVALHAELLYDIPAEAGGIDRIAVLHSDLSDTARDRVMARFRNGEIWVLITTDLLSRGVDFLGVNGVVNYDIPTSSAAYVHRIGRTGRAGRSGGVAVTLYSKEDLPYLKHVANVVAMAQQKNGAKVTSDQWLLDSLPSFSKNEKQKLRKRGIESRASRSKQKDPKAAKKTQISSKSGFDRRLEDRRRGAIAGSKQTILLDVDNDESDFSGLD